MAALKKTFFLTGGRSGMDVVLGGKYKFEEGKCTLISDEATLQKHARILALKYQAFVPENPDFALRQAEDEEAGRHVYTEFTGTKADKSKSGEIESGSSDQESHDGDAAADLEAGQGSDSDRDGHGDTGTEGDEQSNTSDTDADTGDTLDESDVAEVVEDSDLTTALDMLDPANDDHWTRTGLPAVAKVAEIAERPTLTRQDIKDVAPEFVRPEVEDDSIPE